MNENLISILENNAELKDSASILNIFSDLFENEINSIEFAIIYESQVFTKSDPLKSKIKINKNFKIGEELLGSFETIKVDFPKIIFILDKKLLAKNEQTVYLLITILKLLLTNLITEKENEDSRILIDSKIEQLSQLYELSKEFSGILELDYVSKLLVYSIVGQFLVPNFAILYFDDGVNILESRADEEIMNKLISQINTEKLNDTDFTKENFPDIFDAGFQLVLPMQIKNETKGLILLGEKKSKEPYTKYDIEYINSVGSLAIISIENAVLFKEALEKKAIERDLETARIIQKNLLPHTILQPKGYEIAAYSESAKQVGGDYFDLLKGEKGETIFAMGDVSGKGITASLLVANSQAYLKSISKQNLPLDECTNLLNDLVEESTVSGTFITFFWGKLNSKKELTYVNAGHNPPLLVRNGELTKLEKGGLILGMMKTMIPYESETIQLQSGDFIVTFTDGVTEAMNSADEEYSDESMESLCKSLKSQSAEEAKELILEDVKKFTAGYEQSDDITLMVIKVS